MLTLPRPSAALVVACAALFVALGGTSYAALKITGKNVANSSLTGIDVKNRSLGPQEIKRNTLGGAQIKESLLGTVPNAQHATTADTATKAAGADTATKALDADKVGGIPAAQLMTKIARAEERNVGPEPNFTSGMTLATIPDLAPGTYLVTARLTYYNDGAATTNSCTLTVPGGDDDAWFTIDAGRTEALTLQEVVTADSVFAPSVSCTGSGNDDIEDGSIIAIRVD